MKHCYYIIQWDKEKKIGVPVYSACRPVSLPKLEKGQWYGVTQTNLDKRITEKAGNKCY